MSKYKVGDKVVFTVTGMFGDVEYQYYALNKDFSVWEKTIDKCSEPLSAYTEPLEAKIRRQAAEITRLLAENKELKEDKAVLNAKIDAYKLYGDQHEEEYNQTFNQGAEAAWELARKIVLKNGYSAYDLHEIFNCCGSHQALEDYTYPEAVAKVAEWEKAKEEIKVGDIYEGNIGSRCFVIRNIDEETNDVEILWLDLAPGNRGIEEIKHYKKTGRHIDIDSFLKQIGEE